MRNAYLEYVIDYDLGKQLALLENLGMRTPPGAGGRRLWPRILLGLALLVATAFAVRRWRRRGPMSVRPDARIYARLVARLADAGHPRAPHESPTAFAARLRRERVGGAEAFATFAARYERGRFGPVPPDLAALRDAAQRSLAALADRGRPAEP